MLTINRVKNLSRLSRLSGKQSIISMYSSGCPYNPLQSNPLQNSFAGGSLSSYSLQDIEDLKQLETGGDIILQRWMKVENDEITHTLKELVDEQKFIENQTLTEVESRGRVGYFYDYSNNTNNI